MPPAFRTAALPPSLGDFARWAEHLPLMAASFDADRRLQCCNAAYAQWIGAPADALVGQPLSALCPLSTLEDVEPHLRRALGGEIVDYERFDAAAPDGGWLRVRIVPRVAAGGEIEGVFCFMQDTSRMHAQDIRLDLLRNSPGVVLWELDLASGVLHAEQNWLDPLQRWTPKAFAREEWAGRVVAADLPALEQALAQVAAPGGVAQTVEARFVRTDGSIIWTVNHGMVHDRNPDSRARRIFGITWDITELRQTQDRLMRSEQRFRMLAELSNEWFWESDEDDVLTYISRSSRRGQDSPLAHLNLVGQSLHALYPGQEFSPEWAQLRHLIEERAQVRDLVVPFRLAPGQALLWWNIDAAPKTDPAGRYQGYRGVVRDVTEAHRSEEKLQLAAHRDALTGLANRALFEKHVEDAIAVTPPGQSFGVLFIDLDRFKLINDAFGHATGDKVLIETAQRLVQLVRPHNTAARFGGDEFLVLARDATDDALALRQAEVIRSKLGEAMWHDDRQLQFGASIGVALFPQHGSTVSELLARADAAMHQAKTLGRNRIESFSIALKSRVERRSQLEEELRQAIADRRFEAHLQPIWTRRQTVLLHDESASAATLRSAYSIAGFEALARWTRGNGERVAPDEFIPILADAGLLDSFGPAMLDIALEAFGRLRDEGRFAGTLAYNVSPRQFHAYTCAPCIADAMARHRIPSDRLVLELTENVEIENNPDLISVFDAFRRLGVQLALDDFGVGYSNLGYLTRLPVSQIKIDRAIASGVSGDRHKAAIARATLTMAKTLGLEVVAEGVESVADLLWMERAGCPQIQGWVFSRPLNTQQAVNLLRELRDLEADAR